jgi:LysM repeat protein
VSSHRKNRWSARSARTRTLTLCAAVVGGVVAPAIAATTASAASAPIPASSPATTSAPALAAFTTPTAAPAVAAPAAATPVAAADTKPTSYKVVPGDTLSGIAQKILGDGNRYPEIFQKNTAKTQADGRHLSNPDLILVGWNLDLPTGAAPAHQPTASAAPAAKVQKAPVQQSKQQSQAPVITQAAGSYANNLSGWINEARAILSVNGYSVSYNAIYQTVMHESAGNPSATNGWDSNAAAGHPSIGLMQTIAPTFNAFALPGHTNIYNPVDNIIAGARYAASRYGSLDNVVAARCGGSCWFGY